MNYYDFEKLKRDPQVNFNRPYQQCIISLMDTIADPNITFDKEGICNYYHEYKEVEKNSIVSSPDKTSELERILNQIKDDGKNNQYDCITGVSGGVDSTYLVYQLFKFGLRPLIVHFDNGWNSELSVMNIENIIDKTGFNLYTLVVNWEEFRDIQRSYFKASVVDIEIPTDHAIRGTLTKLALKHNIKYILSGSNIVTEHVLPWYWIYNKSDHVNLKSIHKTYGKVPIKTYPLYDYKLKKLEIIKNIRLVSLLDYLPYNKNEAKKTISEEFHWKDYGGKHYESIFTKFYQAYILPHKFHIDKRKAHLSNLIFSGQMSKSDALKEIEKPLYNEFDLKNDYEFVIKKLNFTPPEFEQILSLPRREHSDFLVEGSIFQKYWLLRKVKNTVKYIIKF